ncbi:MAG: prolyl hydroxylase family protein [Parvularculaceae bacterium]
MATAITLEELTKRAEAGEAAAQYALAAWCARHGRREDADRWLDAAVKGGEPEALFTLATRAMHTKAGAVAAAAPQADAAARGSVSAARQLAILRAMGLGVPQDDRAAIDDIGRLAALGFEPARRELAALLLLEDPADPEASRLLSSPAAAADWPALAARAKLSPQRALPPERLAASPDILIFRSALSRTMCDYIMRHATPLLGPALVYDPRGTGMMRDPLRSSATASLGLLDLDLALLGVMRLMSALAGVPARQGEFLSVMRYRPGEQYRPHFDTIPPGPDFDRSGQRIRTALLYLNDAYEGGETAFPAAGLKVRGEPGDIVVFSNVLPDGRGDPASRHAGLPVVSGEKWLVSQWCRERDFEF